MRKADERWESESRDSDSSRGSEPCPDLSAARSKSPSRGRRRSSLGSTRSGLPVDEEKHSAERHKADALSRSPDRHSESGSLDDDRSDVGSDGERTKRGQWTKARSERQFERRAWNEQHDDRYAEYTRMEEAVLNRVHDSLTNRRDEQWVSRSQDSETSGQPRLRKTSPSPERDRGRLRRCRTSLSSTRSGQPSRYAPRSILQIVSVYAVGARRMTAPKARTQPECVPTTLTPGKTRATARSGKSLWHKPLGYKPIRRHKPPGHKPVEETPIGNKQQRQKRSECDHNCNRLLCRVSGTSPRAQAEPRDVPGAQAETRNEDFSNTVTDRGF